ncbi:DHA2 family efflux MFS transporter permease subunit [Rhodococcus triatomae]|uniref:DHA2 family efflux MFS transporter permease subunit n=1 Tax=Rhodococcus triatomae TaxID=300028 RepID=UPI0009344C83|nr:DHA2 family efflux MFS transporter permease subunit [Rhodococcus triatomae]
MERRHLLVIGVLLVASFVVILNETVMTIAIPVLQTELGVQPSVGQWLTTAFMLTMAVVIPLTGYLIQRVPTRTLFVLAMSLFSAGTLIAFGAPGFGVLLFARIVQASGTAIMLPLLMTTIMTLVPPARRGAMMGNISIVIAVAPALGPTVSGFILDHFGWRWIFGFVAPIALATLVLGARLVIPVAETSASRIDLLSVPLAVLGFGGLVYGLVGIGESAEADSAVPVWAPFLVGAVAMAAFVARQIRLQREDRALLDLRVFGSRQFTVAVVAMLLAMATMMGTFIIVPYFAQTVLLFDPLQTGLLTLPGGLLMGLAGPIVGRIYDVRGPRVLVVPGALLISLGVWMLTTVSTGTSLWWLVLSNMALCLGLAATFTPLMTSGLGSIDAHLYSHGSAVVGTFQQVAGAAGTALFVTVMTVVAAGSGHPAESPEAIVDGVRSVFLVAGVLSFVLIAACLFVRKPADAQVVSH